MKRILPLLLILLVFSCCVAAQADLLDFPASLTEIGEEAFCSDASLDEVVLPEGILAIRDRAFADSGLKRIYMPLSLCEISPDALSGCEHVTAWGYPYTYAAEWCAAHDIPFEAITTPADEFTFTITSSTEATLTGWTGNGEVVCIPEMADDEHRITIIGKDAFRGTSVQRVVLSPGITGIESAAFRDCSELISVHFSPGLTRVAGSAFQNCVSLLSADLPDNVTYLGANAFSGCQSLSSFHYPLNLAQINATGSTVSPLYNVPLVTRIDIPEGVTSIPAYLFAGCGQLVEVSLPGTLTEIGSCAFRDCSALPEIFLPASMQKIDGSAFWGCSALVDVHFNDGLTDLAGSAFRNCVSLLDADLPDSVTYLGANAFSGCQSLSSFHYPMSLISLHATGSTVSPLYEVPLITRVDIPEGITSIPAYLFAGCGQLTEVSLPETLTEIGTFTFRDCSSLTKITMPASMRTIGTSAFWGCSSLVDVHLNENLTELGVTAFKSCSSLPWLYVPEAVTTLRSNVFSSCPALTVESEYGSAAIAYCLENDVPCYYLTPLAFVFPDGQIYQGDVYSLYGTVCSNINLTEVSAVVYNDQGEEIRKYVVDPADPLYRLQGDLSNALSLGTLELGTYRLVIEGATALTRERFTDAWFEVVEPPLRVDLSGCEIATYVVQNQKISMTGTLHTNYPIQNIHVIIKELSSDSVFETRDISCGTDYCYLEGVAGYLSAIPTPGYYLLTIQLFAHNETIDAYVGAVECVQDLETHDRHTDEKFSQPASQHLAELELMSADFVRKLNHSFGSTANYMQKKYHFRDPETGGSADIGRALFMWKEIVNADGTYTRVYAMGIQGTQEASQWASNFDLGSGTFHAGFKSFADTLLTQFNAYRTNIENGTDTRKPEADLDNYTEDKYYICGHSRGAAAANILGGYLLPNHGISPSNIYCFCFACPNVKKGNTAASQVMVYNIKGDIVPRVPLGAWGYGRYGTVKEYAGSSVKSDSDSINLTSSSAADDFITIFNNTKSTYHSSVFSKIQYVIQQDNPKDVSSVFRRALELYSDNLTDWIENPPLIGAKLGSLLVKLTRHEINLSVTHDSNTYYAWMKYND